MKTGPIRFDYKRIQMAAESTTRTKKIANKTEMNSIVPYKELKEEEKVFNSLGSGR